MFKVHYPAHSYFKKQLRTYGSAELLKALDSQFLIKSALLHYLASPDGRGVVHDWAPEIDADGRLSISPDLHTPDHPPWSHNPETKRLLFEKDGVTPWGKHPIDYVHHDLMRKFGLRPEEAKGLINASIDRYKGNGGQELPGFDDPRWRKVFYGPFIDEKTPSRDRQAFGSHADGMPEGMQPIITYSLPRGSVNHPMADQGDFIDGGHVHFHHELGEELRERLAAQGMPPEQIEEIVGNLSYVKDSVLKPNQLTRGPPTEAHPRGQSLVGSWDIDDLMNAERTGNIPDNYMLESKKDELSSKRTHGPVHAHQIAHMLPDTFYHGQTGSSGGRPTNAAKEAAARGEKPLTAGQELAQIMSEANMDISQYSSEELEQMGGTKAIKMLFSRTQGQKNDAGGAAKMALRHIFSQLGSSHEDSDYELHRTHAERGASTAGPSYHGSANLRAADVVAHLSNLAGKYEDQGMSAEEAKQKAVNAFRNYEHQSNRYGPVEGLREKTEALIGQMMGAHGHEQFQLGDRPTEHVRSGLPKGIGETHTVEPDHWKRRNLSDNLAPVMGAGPAPQQVVQQTTAAAPVAPPVAPTSAVPMGHWQVPSPEDPRYALGPGQVQFSSDHLMQGLDDIRKKMGYFDGFLRGYQDE